jgi:hypothetical protein
MESAFTYTASQAAEAVEWADFQLRAWGVGTPYVGFLIDEASALLGPGRTGRVVLDYDVARRLLSMDVWCGAERLYGMDDFVSPTDPWLRDDSLREPCSSRVMWQPVDGAVR